MKFITPLLTLLLFTQLRAQSNWTIVNALSGQITITAFATAPNGDLYAAGKGVNTSLQWYPILYKSTNNGLSWANLNISSGLLVKQPAALIFSGNTLLMAGRGGSTTNYVLASTDFGATWTNASTGINQTYRPKDFAKSANGEVYLLTAQGNYNGLTDIYTSFNAGSSWSTVNIANLNPFIEPSSILFDQNNKLYLGALDNINYMTRNLLYTSTNYGQNWSPSNAGIPTAVTVNDLVRGKGSDLFAVCTETVGTPTTYTYRIMKTSNFGGSWSTVSNVTGLSNLKESVCAITHNGYMLLAGKGTNGSGLVFRCPLLAAPIVSTTVPFDILDLNATGGGVLLDTSGLPVTKRGVCWSKSPSPTTFHFSDEALAATNYTVRLSGLEPETKYYLRAFATNSIGTSYGNEVNFTTLQLTAIAENSSNENLFELEVYPIPAKDLLYIRAGEIRGNERICLYDVLGAKRLEMQIKTGTTTIDISNLPQGCYFLTSNNRKCYKVVKQ